MRRFYSLRLDKENINANVISNLLNLENNNNNSYWEHEIIELDLDDGFEFIDYFCNTIETNIESLKFIDISPSDFSIWFLYEYESQCNMEFNSDQMLRLGKLGISLCISCWEG